jgi:uncharacterized protein YifN (PemK superfamily)
VLSQAKHATSCAARESSLSLAFWKPSVVKISGESKTFRVNGKGLEAHPRVPHSETTSCTKMLKAVWLKPLRKRTREDTSWYDFICTWLVSTLLTCVGIEALRSAEAMTCMTQMQIEVPQRGHAMNEIQARCIIAGALKNWKVASACPTARAFVCGVTEVTEAFTSKVFNQAGTGKRGSLMGDEAPGGEPQLSSLPRPSDGSQPEHPQPT